MKVKERKDREKEREGGKKEIQREKENTFKEGGGLLWEIRETGIL